MEYRLHKWVFNQDLSQTTDVLVEKAQEWFRTLNDQDVIELLMTGFIPDTYEENREQEKIFTKLIEVLVGEIFSRIGFDSTIVKTKSESEDLRIAAGEQAILVDTKTYRLGRSQVAPNVKDFVKLHTIDGWIHQFNASHNTKAIGGCIVYPSTHEWKRRSQVYKECSNAETPIVMLSYEILAFLLQAKQSFSIEQFFSLWDYQSHFPQIIQTRQQYWNVMFPRIADVMKIPQRTLEEELNSLKQFYYLAVEEALTELNARVQSISNQIPQKIKNMNEKTVRKSLQNLLLENQTSSLVHSIENIQKNRKLFLTNDMA